MVRRTERSAGHLQGRVPRALARSRRRLVLAVVAVLVATLAVAAAPSPPAAEATGQGNDGMIAFDVSGDADLGPIVGVSPDGGALTELIGPAAGLNAARFPAWSPDGLQLAFVREGDEQWGYSSGVIWTADADGSNPAPVPNTVGAYRPVWTPDGHLSFFRYVLDEFDHVVGIGLYTVGADGQGLTAVLEPFPGWASEPSWSPDGQAVVFQAESNWHGIWRVNVDGSGLTQLAEGGFRPEWSPDGQSISYLDSTVQGQTDLWVMDADGTNERVLTGEVGRGISDHAWSPSGTWIAYTAWGNTGAMVRKVSVAEGADLSVVSPGTFTWGSFDGVDWQALPAPFCSFESGAAREAASPEAGQPPPVVNDWKFGGCFTKTGPTTWESETQINLNGLLITPDSGGKVVLNTATPSLSAVGQVTVTTSAFSVGAVSHSPIPLFHGALNWSLSAASLPMPLQAGMKLLGLGVQGSSATATPGPNPGDLSIGPIEVALPDLIGGTASVTLALRPTGIQPTSWHIGPLNRLLGGLVPIDGLTLDANAQGWGVGGSVTLPGGGSLGGSIAYTDGVLSGASVTAGNLSLFGGVLSVQSFRFVWSAQNGWGAQATATVPNQSGSSVSIDLSYANGALSAGTFDVIRTALGTVARIENLHLQYVAATNRWSGNAQVVLPGPSRPTITAQFVMEAGQFVSGTIDADSLNAALAPGVYLTRLAAQFDSTPWRIQGAVGFGAGPVIDNQPAVRINGGGSYTYPAGNQGGLYRVDANVLLTDFALGSAWLEYRPTGRLTFAGHLGGGEGGINLPGVSISANLNGWVDGSAGYSAEGNASLTVHDLAITGRAVVSSTGVAACGGARTGWTWQTGFGYRWVGNQLTVLGGSCDLRPWTTVAPESAAEGSSGSFASFVVPAGAEVHAVEFTGTTAPPLVTLSGPNGESYATPTDPEDLGVQDEFVVLQDTDAKTTTFLIDTPTAGTWSASLQPGSSPVAETATAEGLPDPEVSATVTGTGANRTLHWDLTTLPGQSVTFVEQGPETSAVITSTSAATGQVPFTPADGPAGTRDIVALIEQDGVPRGEVVAGSYSAPGGATLAIDVSGSGTGTVTSNPAGISCGATCSTLVTPGTPVTLTATPTGGSTFDGWTGPCEGTGACTFTVDVAATVGAAFTAPANQAPTAPTVTGPTTDLLTANAFTVAWSGATDSDGTVTGHDVRYRQAGLNGAFGSPVDWQTATAAASAPFTGTAGTTYCFAARAVDDDGATSAYSSERCAATPLDDRGLTARNGFVRRTGTGNLANTYTEATRRNATLTRNAVTARRIGIIVQRAPGAGTLQVRHAGQLLGTINLQATSVRKKVLVAYTLPQNRTGNVVLTVTSTGKPVRVDGIVALA